MKINWLRIVLVAVAAEVFAIVTLVIIVALLGPSDPAAAVMYAERMGAWVGPIAGFIFCVVGGWFVAKNLAEHHLATGMVLGLVVAAIDVLLIVAAGSAFQWVFVLSNAGKILAGAAGGWIASRSANRE